MAEPISIQQLKDASEDAITLADFIYKPANVMIPRRLAADINSLQYYLDYMSSYAQHSFETYDEMVANEPNLPNGVSAFVTNDLDTTKNGIYTYNGVSFIKGDYQPEKIAKDYVDAKLGGLEVFNGKVRAQDVSTADGGTQEEVNKKTVFEYDTVATMLADTSISIGKVVSTNGYHTKQDGGGAKYIISSLPTDYSIPLANGLHAVFNDSFDIRKFGIRDSATLNQSVELLRMRNYADTREYTIDFHNFSIMSPNIVADMSVAGFSGVRGLWFKEVHHYKNLSIYADKVNRLSTGQCLLIFCPDKDSENESLVVYENITLDPWSDNYQPFTDNYFGAYDGCRHGIFIHPKNDWDALFNMADKDYSTKFNFEFKNINFLSNAYSYNVSQAGIRARSVKVDGFKGDCILAINLDCVDLQVEDFLVNVRRDRVEQGRTMMFTGLHYEPEHGGSNKSSCNFKYKVDLKTCGVTTTLPDSSTVKSGQLLWVSNLAIGGSTVEKVDVDSCFGNIEFQSFSENYATNVLLECKDVSIVNCKDHIWCGFARTVVGKVVYKNSSFRRIINTNSTFVSVVTQSSISELQMVECSVHLPVVYEVKDNSTIGTIRFDKVNFLPFTGVYAYVQHVKVDAIYISNVDYKYKTMLLRWVHDLKVLELDNVIFRDMLDMLIVGVRYTSNTKYTTANFNNVRSTGTISSYSQIALSGKVHVSNFKGAQILPFVLPVDVNETFGAGTGTLEVSYQNIHSEALTLNHSINLNLGANEGWTEPYSILPQCKDTSIVLGSQTNVTVTSYRVGSVLYINYHNHTANPQSINGSISIIQIM